MTFTQWLGVDVWGVGFANSNAYRADPPGPDGQPTGTYRLTGRDTELKFQVEPPQPVSVLGRREKDLLRLAAARVARSMSADSEMMVLRSEQCHKSESNQPPVLSRSHALTPASPSILMTLLPSLRSH